MTLPNADRAIVGIEKLHDYCLNPDHERGKHKARVFLASCGLTLDHAEDLQRQLLNAVRTEPARATTVDRFGRRYAVELEVVGPTGTARVHSSWIVRRDEDVPRFVSCYVL